MSNLTYDPLVRIGNALAPDRSVRGVNQDLVAVLDNLGTPAAAAAGGLVSAATGAELPNVATTTYTFPGSASPIDGSLATGVIDVPRNIVAVATHASSVVAMTIVVTGKDKYGQTMTESFSVPATGTTQTVNGKKAFKSVTSVAITSAGNATTNTLNLGTGDVLGLSYKVAPGGWGKGITGANASDSGTFVTPDLTTPSSTTGDVRGTYDPNAALAGSTQILAQYYVKHGPDTTDLFGAVQA